MTFDSAVEALEGALETDAQAEASAPSLFRQPEPSQQAATESAPQRVEPGATEPQTQQWYRDEYGRFAHVPATEETPAAPAAEDTFAQSFDPNTLSPELQQAYRQMQADYTRKTQEIAERRKQFDALGDPESLQSAAELYQRIQDPRFWPQLSQELAQAMQAYGIQPQVAAKETEAQAPQTPQVDLSALAQDPELAPLAQHIAGLQEKLSGMEQAWQAQQEAAKQEQMHMALVGEMQRQHAIIQSQHPEYGDGDLDAIYELAMAHDGNLLDAQARYEDIKTSVLSGYLDSKQQIATTPVAPIAGAAVAGAAVPAKPSTLEEATDIAMERLRQAGLDTIEF